MSAPQPPSIPTAAQGRLHHSAQPGAGVTSFLTYSEYLMLNQMGLEPIGAVVGLSVMHLGLIHLAGIKQAVELEAYSQFLSAGRLAAIGRMQDEAAALGADGIITQTVVTERRFDAEEHEYS